jgi:serine/threonine-protein kinase
MKFNAGLNLKDPFEVVKEIESDDESCRFLARNKKSGEYVSIKAAFLKRDPALQAQCQHESDILKRIYSPHLVRTYDYWIDRDIFFLVQENVIGVDLESYSAQIARLKGRDQIVRFLRIFKDVSQAVAALHTAGLVLGRITPPEILVEPTGVPKLAYSSIFSADKSAGRMKRRVAAQNTVASIAPEQLKGAAGGPSGDVYALGALMYTVLARNPLVVAARYEDAIESVFSQTPEPPSRSNPEVPPELDSIVMQTLERDPAKRIANAGDLAQRRARSWTRSSPRGLRPRKWSPPFASTERTESLAAVPQKIHP